MTYYHLTLEERYLIGKDKSTGMSMRAIGKKIGRSASSISRELRRNADHSTGRYRYDKAHSYARARLRRCRRGPQFNPAELALVHGLLRQLWSPEQISGRMGLYDCLHVSTSTIYRWLELDKRSGGTLWQSTRRLSRRYRRGYRVKDSRGRMGGKVPLALRPLAANLRQEFAHWEGDTVMGSDGRHCLLTLVERKTRFVRIVKLHARQSAVVNAALAQELGSTGSLIVRSLALDNGTEFHGFAEITANFGTEIYFAQPYHSWERGTNENTNGLIRQYLPKRTCFKSLTQVDCDAIQLALNTRPRKVLGYRTPSEAYIDECCA
jgi:IS30 family transposase